MQTRIDHLIKAAREASDTGERFAMRYYIGEIERELENEKDRVRREGRSAMRKGLDNV